MEAGASIPTGGATGALSLPAHQPARLLDLDEDIFLHFCSFLPIDDLVCHLAATSRAARRRVTGNHALWQQLWMQYVLHFVTSLIPPPHRAAAAAMVSAPPCCDAAWRLYHYHSSKEARPRVELLERLSLSPEGITDHTSAETPKTARVALQKGAAHSDCDGHSVEEPQEQLLSFAQACATRLTVNNLSHEAAPPVAVPCVAAPAPPTQVSAVVMRRRGRQTHRLRRALRFLLSADARRPAFEDRLWTSTFEAGEAYRREMMRGVADVARVTRRGPRQAKGQPRPDKDRLRPLSWLDNRESSVKVLLFDDHSRTVGDASSVQTERIKLLAAIADHWRLAYAHQFYLTPTDGAEQGSGNARPVAPTRGPEVTSSNRGAQSPQQQEGRATWEHVYRRFRDDNGNAQSARIRASLQRVVTAGAGGEIGGSGGTQEGSENRLNPSLFPRTGPIPSSGNALFDLHLLTYTRRKQLYAAMLASTVEVPEGMGAFFATCVSESFLRWWTWRHRQRAEGAANAPKTATALSAFSSAHSAAPTTLWVARVCSVHKPQYGTTANDGTFGRRAPIEAAESIAYTSSYSDVTSSSANTLASDSSIDFMEEVPEDEEESDGEEGPHREHASAVLHQNVGEHSGDADGQAKPQQRAQASQPSRTGAPRVALLFPLPHMLAYWFMMHHVTFYNYQVYRRMWGDQEITIAVCSRLLSPTGHSVECRLFYTLRCAAFPRMYTKMMFTPGTLPALTLQEKMSARSPYRSPTSSAASSLTSPSEAPPPLLRTTRDRRDSDSDSSEEPTAAGGRGDAEQPHSSLPQTTPSPTSSEPRRGKHTMVDTQPVDARHVYDLFWTGFGRVEVESGPTISRSNLVRLRVALGLPVDYPMGLLWNVLMFASGVGPLILKDHRHSLFFNYSKSFTDVLEEEFGEVSCYGYGARPAQPAFDSPMANPLDAEVAMMRERHNLEEAARALVRDMAAVRQTQSAAAAAVVVAAATDGDDAVASFSTAEREEAATEAEGSDPAESPTSSLTTSATTYGSWGLDSDFSSMGGHSSWRDWHTPYSDVL